MRRTWPRAYPSVMDLASPLADQEPPRDCRRCPRLVALRDECRADHPDWRNAPVPAFGDPRAWLAVVGLAPGLRGANRTGRPFTGDGAGDMLFAALAERGWSRGRYGGTADDGLSLNGVIILNSVQCLPPQNRPLASEIAACRPFLERQLAALPYLQVIVALGRIAHDAVVRAAGERPIAHPFAHGSAHHLSDGRSAERCLVDSYHCSRYNLNTGRLTEAMFGQIFVVAERLRVR